MLSSKLSITCLKRRCFKHNIKSCKLEFLLLLLMSLERKLTKESKFENIWMKSFWESLRIEKLQLLIWQITIRFQADQKHKLQDDDKEVLKCEERSKKMILMRRSKLIISWHIQFLKKLCSHKKQIKCLWETRVLKKFQKDHILTKEVEKFFKNRLFWNLRMFLQSEFEEKIRKT